MCSNSVWTADSSGRKGAYEVPLFMDIDRSVATGRMAQIATNIWPDRCMINSMTVVMGDEKPCDLWARVPKDKIMSHVVDGIVEPLRYAANVILCAPHPVVQDVRSVRHVQSQRIYVIPRVIGAYLWAQSLGRTASPTGRIVAMDEYRGTVEAFADSEDGGYWICSADMRNGAGNFESRFRVFLSSLGVDTSSPCMLYVVNDCKCSSMLANYESLCSALGVSTRIASIARVSCSNIAAVAAELGIHKTSSSMLHKFYAQPQEMGEWLGRGVMKALRSTVRTHLSRETQGTRTGGTASTWRKTDQALDLVGSFGKLNPEALYDISTWMESPTSPSPEEALKLREMLLRTAVGGRPILRSAVMISPFSCGKSTLINAMIGQPILSADVRAETSCPIRIMNSSRLVLVIEYVDGFRIRELPGVGDMAETVESMASVRSKSADHQIQSLYVGMPLPERVRQLELIDTPGYFSRWEGHDSATDSLWRDADLVVALIDPTSVGDEHFTAKVKSIAGMGKKMIYVVSKIDMYPEAAAETTAELRMALGDADADVISVSGYLALKARMWQGGNISLEELQHDRKVFALDNGEQVRGRLFLSEHVELMQRLSNIDALESALLRLTGATGGVGVEVSSDLRETRVSQGVS